MNDKSPDHRQIVQQLGREIIEVMELNYDCE